MCRDFFVVKCIVIDDSVNINLFVFLPISYILDQLQAATGYVIGVTR